MIVKPKFKSPYQQILIVLMTFIIGCGGQSSGDSSSNNYSERNGYEDGTYCAEIDYYYSETGTSSTYTLEVEIENNELTEIHWPNGGWLDDSHFLPPDISDGEVSFTSYRGVDYTVRVLGKQGDCSLDTYVTDEDELIEEKEEEENRIRQQEENKEERLRQEEEEEEEQRKRQEQEEDEERRRQEEENNDE